MKALEWDFKGYEGKHIICYYITHKDADNVLRSYDDIDGAIEDMDELELWDDYYIYEIKEDGFAYAPKFG